MDRQPNYVTIACVLAVLYLVVKHLQMSKELSDLGRNYSELGQGFSWLYNQSGFGAQQQPRRRAPDYEQPRGRDQGGQIHDRSERRQDRPIQNRDKRSGGGPQHSDDTAMSADYNFLDDCVFGEFKGGNKGPKGGRSRG